MDISAVREVSQSEVEIFVDSGNGRADDEKTGSAVSIAEKNTRLERRLSNGLWRMGHAGKSHCTRRLE